jgi:hypothetical protein
MSYKISDIKEISNDFLRDLNPITVLSIGDKLVVDENDKIVIDNNFRLVQPFTRWWGKQNRNNVLNCLVKELDIYQAFMKFLTSAYNSERTSSRDRDYISRVFDIHIAFSEKLTSGLRFLIITYNDSSQIKMRLEELIDNLSNLPKLNRNVY